MSIATGIAVYLVIWWTVLFAILPLGIEPMRDPAPGHDRGAPARPAIGRKALITSIVAAVLWLGFYVIYEADLISFRRMADQW